MSLRSWFSCDTWSSPRKSIETASTRLAAKKLIAKSFFRILALSGCFAYMLLELGEICVFASLAIHTECPLPGSGMSVPGCEDIYYLCRAMLHGVLLVESTCIAACIERTLSTFVGNYEKRSFTCAALCLLVFAVGHGRCNFVRRNF